jgi:hypothetical protein
LSEGDILKYPSLLLLLIFLVTACTLTTTPAPVLTPTSTFLAPATATGVVVLPAIQPTTQVINLELLRNFTYVLESSGGMQVTLIDGSFKVDDTAHNMTASGQLVLSALGDLNGDGVPDAAVTLAANLGGSGTFHELIVVLSQDGKAVQAADLFLEDRLQENKLSITDGLITLDAVRHGPHDPMCCPTEHAITVYRYQTGKLEVVSDKVVASAPNLPVTQYPNTITLDSPQDGTVTGSSLLLRGKTSQMPFEKNLVVRVYSGSTNTLVLEQPQAVQGEYGGPGSFETNLQLPADLKGTVRIDVVDLDPAVGQPRGLASVVLTVQ